MTSTLDPIATEATGAEPGRRRLLPPLAAGPGGTGGGGVRGRLAALTGGASAAPLAALTLIQLIDEVDRISVGVLSPEIRDWFGVDLTTLSLINALSVVVVILFAIPIGYLSDRVRRVPLVGVAAIVQGAFCFASSFAPSLGFFSALRLGAGMSKVVEPAQGSLVADSYRTEVRPGVFAIREGGTTFGRLVGPVIAGGLASLLFWQAVYVAIAVPTVLLGLFVLLRLKEPARGEQERRMLGADEAVALKEDRPPSLSESFRIIWNVRTLRSLTYSLPFTIGAYLGFSNLLPLYLNDVFDVGPATRGVLSAVTQPFGILGLVVGGAAANRVLAERPARVVAYAGIMSVVTGLLIGGLALSPVLAVAVLFSALIAFTGSILTPATTALLTVVVPPKARGLGLSLIAIGVIPGLGFQILASNVADDHGLRIGMLVMVPVFCVGAVIFGSAATSVGADLRAATASAMAAQASEEARRAGATKLLVIRDLDVAYGPVQILFGLDLDVDEGEVVALLGTNGAGKSTLLKAVCGLVAPANGAISYDGDDITFLPAHEHVGRGIVMMPGGKGVFPSLTVDENLKVATWSIPDEDVDAAIAEVHGFFPILAERAGEAAGNLSGGEQQMLALGQAFLARPRLLLIDELSLGLAPAIVEQLLVIIRAFKARGVTVVLVEQSVNVALTIAERAVFLEKGEVRFSGPTADLLARPDILRSVYLQGVGGGRGSVAATPTKEVDAEAGPALEAIGLRKSFGGVQAVRGVSFTLAQDRILGIIGPNGAGKTSLFDLLSGFTKPDEGQLLLLGEDITSLGADQRANLGLVRSFQDARLFPSLTVAESIAVALERQVGARSATQAALHLPNVKRSEEKVARRVDRLVELFGLGPVRDKFISELSTGQRRIVDLAGVLAAEPKVVLLDEPSSGIAQKEAEALGPLLLRIQRETGCSMVVIEHDMPLLLSVSDELLALELGAPIASGDPKQVLAHPRVIASYLGEDEATINRSGRAGS